MALQIQVTTTANGALDVIDFDASITEGHSFSADITDYPVEKGSNVTDNVRRKPDMLKLETFVSDNPLQNDGRSQTPSGATLSRATASPNRSKGVLEKLQEWLTNGQTLQVFTGIKQYDSMVLQSIDMPRDKSVAGGLRLSLTLKEIRVVSTQQVEVTKAKEAKGEKKSPTGPQTTEPTDDGPKKSIGAMIVDDAIGF